MDNFDKYAQFYNLFYQDKDYVSEANTFLSILANFEIPVTSSILEIGCGAGWHLEVISSTFPNSLGIEPSSVMIDLGSSSVKDRIMNSSFEDFESPYKFKLIYALFHVFSYIEDIEKFFEKLAFLTEIDGFVCFDFWQTSGVFHNIPEVRSRWLKHADFQVHRIATPTISETGDYVEVLYDIYVHELNLERIVHFSEKHRMFLRTVSEVVSIANRFGFKMIENIHLTNSMPVNYTDWDTGLILKRVK